MNPTIQKAREASQIVCDCVPLTLNDKANPALDAIDAALDLAERLEQDNERLVKALGFYASASRYQGANQRILPDDEWTDKDAVYRLDVTRDGGAIARKALGESE